jgi:hypothetical protein
MVGEGHQVWVMIRSVACRTVERHADVGRSARSRNSLGLPDQTIKTPYAASPSRTQVTDDKPPAHPERGWPLVSLVTDRQVEDHQNHVTPGHQGGRDALLSPIETTGRGRQQRLPE